MNENQVNENQPNEMQKYFSVLSGQVYDIEKNTPVDRFQIPVHAGPKSACKKCYGRGYVGIESNLKYYVICSCLRKHVDFDRLRAQINAEEKKAE